MDISIEDVKWFKLDTKNPRVENPRKEKEALANKQHISQEYNKNMMTIIEANPELEDFYNDYSNYDITDKEIEEYETFLADLDDRELGVLQKNLNFYEFTFKNIGGLVMPLIIQLNYTDGTTEIVRIPAEIWRINEAEVTKVLAREKELESAQLDPYMETADVDEGNNYFPHRNVPSRFELFKNKPSENSNPMQENRNSNKVSK